MNIASQLVRSGLAQGARPAVARGTTVLTTYAELSDRAARLARALREDCKLNAGDRVALAMKNCPAFLEVLYACWHAGLVAVPVNAKLHQSEFAYILDNSGTRLCFATDDLVETLAPLTGDALERVICVDTPDYAALLNAAPMECASRQPDDAAWLFYTSGTTGQPKGATLSHRNLLAMSYCYFADVDQGAPWDCILHAAPMSHGSGLYSLPHVAQASCHVLPESGRFEPPEIYALIEAWPNLSFFAAPTMVKRLLDDTMDRDTCPIAAPGWNASAPNWRSFTDRAKAR